MSRSRPSTFLALKLVALAAICSVGLIAMPAAASAADGDCVAYDHQGAPLVNNSMTVVAGSLTNADLVLYCAGSATADTYTVDNTGSTGPGSSSSFFDDGVSSAPNTSVDDAPNFGGVELSGNFVAPDAPNGQYTDSFTFTASNGGIDTFPVITVNVLVNPAPPVCTITDPLTDNQNVVQGTEATPVAFTCTDNGDGPVLFSGGVQGEHGFSSVNEGGTKVDYLADAHESGADTVALVAHTAHSGFPDVPLFFTYNVTDAAPACTPLNETVQGGQDAAITFSFEPRCSDADDSLTYTVDDSSSVANGFLSITGNQADYNEASSDAADTASFTDTFQVVVSDGNPDHVITVPVTVTVNPDHAPVCTTVSGDDNQSVVHGDHSIAIRIVCSDPDTASNPGDANFSVSLDFDSLPTQGYAELNENNDLITYSSNYEGLGPDTIAVVVSGGAVSSTLLVHVNVTDAAPACADVSYSLTNDSSDGGDLACTDADGDFVSYDVGRAPANGSLYQSGSFFYYAPNAGFVGTDSFTVLADDGSMQTPITVTAHVSAAPPVVVVPPLVTPPVVVAPVVVPVTPVAPVTPIVPPVVIVTPPAPKLSSPVTVKDGKVSLELGCANQTTSCKASVALTTKLAGKTVSLGTQAITIKSGKNGAIKISLSGAARKALKASAGKTITVTVAIKTTNPKTGKTVSTTKALKVKVPR
jgi:hypothetical protein